MRKFLDLQGLETLLAQNRQTTKKEKADKHTRKGNNKNNEGKQGKHKWKHAEYDHVKKKSQRKAAKQNPSSI
jgi:hypothetical protein